MNYHTLNDNWFNQLRLLIHSLKETPIPPWSREEQRGIRDLVNKVMVHYEEYYTVNPGAAKRDVLDVFAAPWCTPVERSLMWIGGWRPTMVFHLVVTEWSILFGNTMEDVVEVLATGDVEDPTDLLESLHTGDLGDLSDSQFLRVDDLKYQTVQLENSINGQLSDWQDTSCQLMGPKAVLDEKMEVLSKIVSQADDLRMKTIKKVVDLLSLQQAAEFVVAAAELQFGVRMWGTEQDRT